MRREIMVALASEAAATAAPTPGPAPISSKRSVSLGNQGSSLRSFARR